MSSKLHPELRPDARLVAGNALNLIRLVELLASSGMKEWTSPDIEAELDLSPGQVRGLLHTAWDGGWVRPVQDNPKGKVISRWALDLAFLRTGETWRRAVAEEARRLNAEIAETLNRRTKQTQE